jgi:all-trans-retinol dehydrogenase (NAD+)
MAKLGCIVVIWDMNIVGAEETCAIIRKSGNSAQCYKCDVTNRQDVYDLANRVRAEIGDITILVNNAGIVSGKKIFDPDNSDAYMEKTVQVNTISHFWTVKAFLPTMVSRNHGHLVTIASSAGLVGVNGLADYCASKFGKKDFHNSAPVTLTLTFIIEKVLSDFMKQ